MPMSSSARSACEGYIPLQTLAVLLTFWPRADLVTPDSFSSRASREVDHLPGNAPVRAHRARCSSCRIVAAIHDGDIGRIAAQRLMGRSSAMVSSSSTTITVRSLFHVRYSTPAAVQIGGAKARSSNLYCLRIFSAMPGWLNHAAADGRYQLRFFLRTSSARSHCPGHGVRIVPTQQVLKITKSPRCGRRPRSCHGTGACLPLSNHARSSAAVGDT